MDNQSIPLPMFAVWIPSKGWVRGRDNKVVCFLNKKIADQLSIRIGEKSKVYYYDESLGDIEEKLKDAERNHSIRLKWLLSRK